MKHFSFRLGTALLAFGVGVIVTTLWLERHSLLTNLRPQISEWEVKFSTGGGMDGNGQGGWIITSKGDIAVGTQPQRAESRLEFLYPCKGRLSAEQLRKIEQVVLAATPPAWPEQYIDPKYPYGYADAYSYRLQLKHKLTDGSEKIYETSWADAAGYLLPKDVAAIQEAAWTIRNDALNRCFKPEDAEGSDSLEGSHRQARETMVSGGVLNNKAISKPEPAYPANARTVRLAGTVVIVQVVVNGIGEVISARAVSGHELLQSAAVQAARQARFAPTTLKGRPVLVSGTLTYNFPLER